MTSHINGVDSYIASGNKDMVEHMLSLRKVATIGPTSSAVVVPATEAFVVTAEAYGNDYEYSAYNINDTEPKLIDSFRSLSHGWPYS